MVFLRCGEVELLSMEVLQCGKQEWAFLTFCLCDLDLDPMTFTYKLDTKSLISEILSDRQLERRSVVKRHLKRECLVEERVAVAMLDCGGERRILGRQHVHFDVRMAQSSEVYCR